MGSFDAPTSHPYCRLHKKQVTHEDKMYSVTCIYISLKCYIKLFTQYYIVANGKRSLNALARAIANFESFNFIGKKLSEI